MIPLNDFQRFWKESAGGVQGAVERVGNSGWYILGKEVQRFEVALAQFWGLGHAVGVANGLDAIEIALRALDFKAGDKVITTPLTAFATTLAIMRAGGVPLFVDVDAAGLLDLARCRKLLQEQRDIRFMIPVHLYGFAVDLNELEALRKEFKLVIVEDCAQSIGATSGGRATGSVGQAAATSFYPTKNLGALGDGGALLTNDDGVAQRAGRLRHYGQSAQYVHDDIGLNSRLDELQAAILGDVCLPRLAEWTKRRRQVATRYLAGVRHSGITLPEAPSRSEPAWHLFPIRVDASKRQAFREEMKEKQVATAIHYPTLVTEQKALQQYGRFEVAGPLNQAEMHARSEVSLPIHPFLTDAEITDVIEACNQWKA